MARTDPSPAQPRPARSLAQELRGWPEDRLLALLAARPDLASPLPRDSAQVAARAVTRGSLAEALDDLDVVDLHVLDLVMLLGPAARADFARLPQAEPARVESSLDRLADLALVWGTPGELRAVSGLSDGVLGRPSGPSGLRPRSAHPLSPADLEGRLDRLSLAARGLLDQLDGRGGAAVVGRRGEQDVREAPAQEAVDELVAARLLAPGEHGAVSVPGEVGLALRGGRSSRTRIDVPPALATTERDPSAVDRVAAGAAYEAVRRVGMLLDHWGTSPPPVLRAGGLGVRELRAAAGLLHTDSATTGLLLEVASAARLVAPGSDAEGAPVWLPTDAADAWSDRTASERWLHLARAWWASRRTASAAGRPGPARGPGGGKAVPPLAPELESPLEPETRQMALHALGELAPGVALAPGTGPPSLVALLAWRRPRRPRARAEHVVWALGEAAALGITGLDGLGAPGRALVAGDGAAAAARLAVLMPPEVDHVLIQGDLTAVAPGPLAPDLSRRLSLVADVESRGGATVYRFSRGSLRRALEAGWSAEETHRFLASCSRTPVPQPLSYLVDDTARSVGALRVGAAQAFLRVDDPSLLAELLARPGAGETLGLRRLAPTVAVSDLPAEELLERLRDLGMSPVVETGDGTIRFARPGGGRRARTPREPAGSPRQLARSAAHLARAVASVRAGDRAGEARPGAGAQAVAPGDVLAMLRSAAAAGSPVWVGYVDHNGSRSDLLVDPVGVDGGWLTAYDRHREETRTFAVHRITLVRVAGSDGQDAPERPG